MANYTEVTRTPLSVTEREQELPFEVTGEHRAGHRLATVTGAFALAGEGAGTVEPLVVALTVVVLDEFGDRAGQVPFVV
jgi:hypothetical protein